MLQSFSSEPTYTRAAAQPEWDRTLVSLGTSEFIPLFLAKMVVKSAINVHLVKIFSVWTKLVVHLSKRVIHILVLYSTYNVEVRRVGSARVSSHPGRAASLHVNNGGAQAVNVRLGVVSSTQNQLWTHIHLNERRTA